MYIRLFYLFGLFLFLTAAGCTVVPGGTAGSSSSSASSVSSEINYPNYILEVSYTLPGPDGQWFTPDDVAAGYQIYFNNNLDNIVYTTGSDHIPLTSDDAVTAYWTNIGGSGGEWVDGPGPDGKWFTADDHIDHANKWDTQPERYYTNAGPDGIWMTADDVQSGYYEDTVNANGDKTRRIFRNNDGTPGLDWYGIYWKADYDGNKEGIYWAWTRYYSYDSTGDGIIGNSDDHLRSYAIHEFSDGSKFYTRECIYSDKGYDGIMFSSDDVLAYYKNAIKYDSFPTSLPVTNGNEHLSRQYSYNQAQALGKGTTFGNMLDAYPDEGSWTSGEKIKEEYMDLVTNAGFNTIRIPIRFSDHALTSSPYTIDAAFQARVDQVVQWALERNLRVIIDMHHYLEIHNDPAGHSDRFIGLWKQIAAHYKNYPSIVYYELLNEPNNCLTVSVWNTLSTRAIQEIRKIDGTHTIIVSAVNWANSEGLNGLTVPLWETNCIVTFHYYKPFLFVDQGEISWLSADVTNTNIQWPGPPAVPLVPVAGTTPWVSNWINDYNTLPGAANPCSRELVSNDIEFIYNWGLQNDRPLWLGEFCTHPLADMTSRSNWTAAIREHCEYRNISWCYWSIVCDVPLYDINTHQWLLPLMGALGMTVH